VIDLFPKPDTIIALSGYIHSTLSLFNLTRTGICQKRRQAVFSDSFAAFHFTYASTCL